MIHVKRRTVLAGATSAAILSTAAGAHGADAKSSFLTVYSPGLPQARALAAKDGKALALNGDLVTLWRAKSAHHRGAVKGYTSWSDYVVMRGLAEERGLRLRTETKTPVGAGKMLFAWVMA